MSIESNCPNCQTRVRIPESLLGKSVKCPKCQTVFRAEASEAPLPYEEVPEDEPRPRRRPRPAPVEDEYDDRYEEADDYEPQPRRRGGRRRAAQAAKAPAIALTIVGGLGLLYGLINVVSVLAGRGLQFAPAGNPAAFRAGLIVGATLSLIWGIVVTLAGVMMLTMKSYGTAMTGVIFAMLPCNPGCLLGLPFGIWGLVVLNRPEVKRAFE